MSFRTDSIAFSVRDNTAYVTAYGADPTGTNDSTAAIQAAINAVAANVGSRAGGRVIFPPGQYLFTSLDISSCVFVQLEGMHGYGAGFGGGSPFTPPSTLICTAPDNTTAIKLNSSFGCKIKGLGILYSSLTYTGILIDYGHATGADATYNVIENCLIGSTQYGAWNAECLVSYSNATVNTIRDCHLQGGKIGVRFRKTNAEYSNHNSVNHCLFRDFQTAATANAATQCSVVRCVFEPNSHQGANAFAGATGPTYAPAYTCTIASDAVGYSYWCSGLQFVGNTINDFPAGVTQFDSSGSGATAMYALTFEANCVSVAHFGNLRGASISKNTLNGGTITFDAAGTYSGVSIVDNQWTDVVGSFVNLPVTAFVKGNTLVGSTTPTTDQMTLYGPLKATSLKSNSVDPQTGTQITIGGTTDGTLVQLGASDGNCYVFLGNGQSGGGFNKIWNNTFLVGNVSTSGATAFNSPKLYFWPSYWNGSAAAFIDMFFQGVVDTTVGPRSHLALSIGGTNIRNWTDGGAEWENVGTAIASATTIAPTARITPITGTTPIATITPPPGFTTAGFAGKITLVFKAVPTWTAAGNIAVAGTPTTANTSVDFTFIAADGKWYPSRTS